MSDHVIFLNKVQGEISSAVLDKYQFVSLDENVSFHSENKIYSFSLQAVPKNPS